MNLGTVPSAEPVGVGSVEAQDTFIPQYALPVVWGLQCHFSLRRDDQSTAGTVTLKLGAELSEEGVAVLPGVPSSQRRHTRIKIWTLCVSG